MMSNDELYLREKVAFLQEMIKKHSYNDSLCAKFREELRPFQAQLDELMAYKEKQNSLAAIMRQAKEALADLRNMKVG
ncbi:hypothetical protein SAMN05421780_11425 [Flexibacter flexilis DSM 6793]|uniref:Uncharacterized protein n=1 Tax=Flexibacter flexilis DSM 6793 TaxID=927664 RepID=A0A1I1NDH5_9BACT|nr:hypothetical protein [Flexibacter flexilis]SFC95535.1 hypothetical protein SAMN05421780_11425 [Flexibacter flexilis DSM 6793]